MAHQHLSPVAKQTLSPPTPPLSGSGQGGQEGRGTTLGTGIREKTDPGAALQFLTQKDNKQTCTLSGQLARTGRH